MTTLATLVRSGHLEFNDGYRTKSAELAQAGFRIVRAGDIRDGRMFLNGPDFVSSELGAAVGEKTVRPGDVVLTTKGTVGRAAIVNAMVEAAVYSPQMCYFRLPRGAVIERRYFYYWLNSPEFKRQAGYLMESSDMAPYLSLRDLSSMRISLPPLESQVALGEVLGGLDARITSNQETVAASVAIIQAVCGNPSAGKVELAAVANLMKGSVKPDAMGRVAHFSLPAFDADGLHELTQGGSILSNKQLVQRPCVLLSKLNPRIPRIWDVTVLPEQPALASTEFLVLEGKIPTGVLWGLLIQPEVQRELEGLARGTTGSHQRVKPDDAMRLSVSDPAALGDVAISLVDALSKRIWLAKLESRTLAALRDTLLPALISGRLSVRDVEAAISEVV